MQPLSGSAGRPADHSPERSVPQSDQYCSMDASKLKAFPVDSSAVQPAHHPSDADGETITGDGSHKGDERQKEAAKPKAPPPARNCAGDAFAECLSIHAVEAFFQQCSGTELTGPEVDLLNSLFRVAEMVQAVLPRSVSLQEWAHRRVPRGFERQVNSSGLVYVGGRFLQYVPLLRNEPRSVSSAAQPASDSIVAQSAPTVEEQVLDDEGRYNPAVSAAWPAVFDSTPAEPASAVEEELSASSYSNATGESAVSQEAAYSYNYWRHPTVGSITGGMCLECGWAITTRPWDVWWTTLLVPESFMSRRPMCSPECLVEYCSAIYCPHAAMENGLQDRMWAQLSKAWKRSTNLSAMPREVLLPIVKFVGAHNLETIWTCSECKPYWYNWYCSVCRMSNRFLHWSPSSHYGHCGASCDCCRSAKKQIFPCEFCENLRNLKATCPTMQDLVKSYEGT